MRIKLFTTFHTLAIVILLTTFSPTIAAEATLVSNTLTTTDLTSTPTLSAAPVVLQPTPLKNLIQVDRATDEINYHIKERIAQLKIEMTSEKLDKVIEQAENFVEKVSQGPRENRQIAADDVQNIKNSFEQYLKKNYLNSPENNQIP